MSRVSRKCFSLLLVVLALSCAASGQEVRASLTGTVTDSTGAAVAGAAVNVTSLATNAVATAKSNESGSFLTSYLAPGQYQMTVEAAGFKKFIRQNIVLQAGDRVRLDVSLEVGELTTSVTVSESVSQLQTETSTRSQTLASEIIANVPTQGRNPYQIAWAASGVVKTGTFRYLRSFDIGGMSGLSINGGRGKTNEMLIDGISNVRAEYTVISAPTTESVQEFKVQANTYDAQFGRTGGGIITIVTKGGGNDFHGTAFEYFQNDKLNANQTELKQPQTAGGVYYPNGRKPPNHINQFGAMASGPYVIPKVVNTKNRAFWMLSWESLRQRNPDPGVVTVPEMAWRTGDFTTRYNAAGRIITIYDPYSTQANGSRTPIAGNVIPSSQISPVATKVLSYYSAPTGPGSGPAKINNFPYPSIWRASFDQFVGRTDVVVNSRNNVFFRYNENPFQEFRAIVFGFDNPGEPSGNAPLLRNGRNVMMNWTSTISPTMTFDLRAGLNRWEEAGGSSIGADFDAAQLGFASVLTSQFPQKQFPRFDFSEYQSVGSDAFGPGTRDTYSLQPNFNKVWGRHFLKFGVEARQYNRNEPGRGYPSGQYSFTKGWTQAQSATADAASGDSLASFLMGLPASAQVQKNINTAYVHFYYAGFFQDDWKVTSRLTLNFGLRYDVETGNRERYNRMVRGLDFNAASPIAGSVAGLALKGAVQFSGVGGVPREIVSADRNNWQPRIGAAYKVRDKWVLRGGYGLYYIGADENGPSTGFGRTTSAVLSTNSLTPYPGLSLANAFISLPGSKLLDPIGTSLGAASFLGEALTSYVTNRALPYTHQYSFDIQRELPGSILVEVGYGGNTTRRLSATNYALNYIPSNEMGRVTSAGVVDTAYYTALVPNPMAGLIPNNAALNGATIQRRLLWWNYPQYSGVTLASIPIGRNQYHGVNFKVTKRISRGLSFLAAYTIGKNLQQIRSLNTQEFGGLNNYDATRLIKEPYQDADTPQKFVIAGIYELPFGKGKPFAGNPPALVDHLIGGWQLNYNVTYQAGWIVDYPNAPQLTAGSAKLDDPTFSQVFNTSMWKTSSGAMTSVPNTTYLFRTWPYYFSDVRRPGYGNWDVSLSKYFPITEKVKLQFRFEMVNMMNHPWFADMLSTDVTNAGFGQLNPTQRNLPRFIKLAMHLNW
ncbi:MAG: TonB-dependent receptor [Acidobacteria bacterium]|nr:TonB-dependent receptor [Acidobacteriota bacterium]